MRKAGVMIIILGLGLTLSGAEAGAWCAEALAQARIRKFDRMLHRLDELEAFVKDGAFPINGKAGEQDLYMYWLRNKEAIHEILEGNPQEYPALRATLYERAGGDQQIILDVMEAECARLGKVPGPRNRIKATTDENTREPFPWVEMYYEHWDWLSHHASPALRAAVVAAGWKKGSLAHLEALETFVQKNERLPRVNMFDKKQKKLVRIPGESSLRGAIVTHLVFVKQWASPELLALLKAHGY